MTPEQALERWQTSMGNGAKTVSNDTNLIPAPLLTTASSAAPAPGAGGVSLRSKSVLLVDANAQSREARAKVMRTLGVRVETAGRAQTARARLATETYNLVLVDAGRDIAAAKSLGDEIKARNPRQLVGFLVGSPRFIATSLE
jgi:hypothetical protein